MSRFQINFAFETLTNEARFQDRQYRCQQSHTSTYYNDQDNGNCHSVSLRDTRDILSTTSPRQCASRWRSDYLQHARRCVADTAQTRKCLVRALILATACQRRREVVAIQNEQYQGVWSDMKQSLYAVGQLTGQCTVCRALPKNVTSRESSPKRTKAFGDITTCSGSDQSKPGALLSRSTNGGRSITVS